MIVADGRAVGRLLIAAIGGELRLVDISLLPERRNNGIGGALVHDLMHEAARARLGVRLHVERDNPARRLYTRLGFVKIADEGPYVRMVWASSAGLASRHDCDGLTSSSHANVASYSNPRLSLPQCTRNTSIVPSTAFSIR